MYKKLRIDLYILLLALAMPVVIWLLMEPVSLRFASNFMLFTSLGQLTGIIGMTLVSISMIFQVRNQWMAKFLAKPTTLSNVHHETALWGLYLLLLHPILLAIRLIPSSVRAAADFLFTKDLVNLSGLIALLIMIISLYMTLFVARSFKYWKLMHQLLLVAYAFLLYHLLFVQSDISSSAPLKIYILGLAILGGLSFGLQKMNFYLDKRRKSDVKQ